MVYYKYLALLERQPEVIFLGSSRGFFFHEVFFHKSPEQFYNFSIGALAPLGMQGFLENILKDNLHPKVIFLSFDLPHFNAHNELFPGNSTSLTAPPNKHFQNLLFSSWRTSTSTMVTNYDVVFDALSNRIYAPYTVLTVGAIQEAKGFRRDGSLYWHEADIESEVQGRLETMRNQANRRDSLFERGTEVKVATMNILENILILAQENDITVVGYFPPYREEFWNILTNPEYYSYIPLTQLEVSDLFAKYQMPFFDFSNGIDNQPFSSEDFYDAWHPSERVMLELYRHMVETNPEIFEPYSDLDFLTHLLDEYKTPFSTIEIVEPVH